MTTSRRDFIAGAGAVIAALRNLPAYALGGTDAAAKGLLAEFAEELLAAVPAAIAQLRHSLA